MLKCPSTLCIFMRVCLRRKSLPLSIGYPYSPLRRFKVLCLVLDQDGPFRGVTPFSHGSPQHAQQLIQQRELHLPSACANTFCAFTGPVSQARDAPVQNTARYSHLLIHQEYREHKRVTLDAFTPIYECLVSIG